MGRTSVLLVAVLAAAAGIDFTSFRPFYSHTSRLDWHVVLDGSSGSEDVGDTWHRSSLGGSLSPELGWLTRTQSDRIDFSASLPLDMGARYDGWSYPGRAVRHSEYRVDFSPGCDFRWYPGLADLHVAGIASGMARFDYDNVFYVEGDTQTRRETDADLEATIDVGIGYGRMRDAWPLAKAVRMVGLLQEQGVLARPLTDVELHELAGFISRSWRLFYNHDRPYVHYYDSLEACLVRLGAIARPLPAYALFRLDEGLYIGSDARPFGWRVFGLVMHRGEVEWSRSRGSDTGTWYDTSWARLTRFVVEYARPFGMYWTTAASLDYESPWLAWPEPEQDLHAFRLRLSASRAVADRFAFGAAAQTEAWFRPRPEPWNDDRLNLVLSARVSGDYYVAERMRVGVYLTWTGSGLRQWSRNWDRSEFSQRWSLGIYTRFGLVDHGWTDPRLIM